MSRKLSDEIIKERATKIYKCLCSENRFFSTEELTEKTGLTVGQIKGAVKFERRYFLDKPDRCGGRYILSGARGYKVTQTDDDYIAMYKSLYAWGKSVLITISPVGKYLQGKGIDVVQLRAEAMEGIGNGEEVGGADSWQE